MKFFNSQNFAGITKGPVILNFYRPTDTYANIQMYKKVGSYWKNYPFNKGKILEKATSIGINYAYAGYLNECNYTMTKETITRIPPHVWRYTFTLNKVSVHGYSVWDYARAAYTWSSQPLAGITPIYQITFLWDETTGNITDITFITFERLSYDNRGNYGGMLELSYESGSSIYMRAYSNKTKTTYSSASPITLRDDMVLDVPRYTSFFGRYMEGGEEILFYDLGSCIRLSYTPEHTDQQVHIDESWNAWFYLSQGADAWNPNADPDGGSGGMQGGMLGTNGQEGWGSRDLEFDRDSYPRQTDQ